MTSRRDHSDLFPVFLKLDGRSVLVVGGGAVAAGKIDALAAAGARITVVAPSVADAIRRHDVVVHERPFRPSDLEGCWLVVAAAPPEVNRAVAREAEARRVFVNAVDDPAHATAYLGGVLRRDGVAIAISTGGRAPALAGLLREGFEALLPLDLDRWFARADELRRVWRSTAVPMNERRPALLEALVSLYEHRRTDGADPRAADALGRGMVALVGAGPGDPDLVTRRAADRLRAADVVFFDGLVAPPILSLAPHARHVSVARRAGQKALAQDDVAAMMIEAALDGQRVVRLKSGDPFVFARGGEEVEALARAGVPFEIVPGITSALAAPALARIPVTHRGIASAFVVISGHARAAYEPVLASVAPGAATVVVLMGMAERAGIGGCLVAAGWPDETPVAIVTSASRPDEHVWVGTIARLAEPDPLGLPDGPSVIVVGDVVRAARAEMAAGEEPATRSNANGRRARGAAADAIAAHDPRAGEPVRRTGAAGASGDETTAGVLEVQGHQRS